MLRTWKSIYEERLLEGWEALLKVDKANYYAYHLQDGFFAPQGVKDRKLLEKLKQIVVPELREYGRKLEAN